MNELSFFLIRPSLFNEEDQKNLDAAMVGAIAKDTTRNVHLDHPSIKKGSVFFKKMLESAVERLQERKDVQGRLS